MSNPIAVLVDGKALAPDDARDWPLDRGLQYGDGLFETMMVRGGHIRFADLHRQRLAKGCERLRLRLAQAPLWEQAASLAGIHGDAVLKLLVTRGPAAQRGYGTSGQEIVRTVLYAFAPSNPADIPADVHVVTLKARLGENPALAGLKHCNRLEQVLARMELQPTGAFEGLMGTGSGRLISGTMSNVFLDTDDGLVTPALDQCGVDGVMRAVALRAAEAMGLPVRIAAVPWSALRTCRGLFLTNVRLGVLPVGQLDGRVLQVGEAMRALARTVAAS
jgi:4-amino-4-deoxychorismate lyase